MSLVPFVLVTFTEMIQKIEMGETEKTLNQNAKKNRIKVKKLDIIQKTERSTEK